MSEVVFQTQVAECSLACLAMILAEHGDHISLRELRAQFSVGARGVNLAQLVEMAEQCGLKTRALRVEIDELDKLKLPAILHWDLNHFVVLTKVGRKRCIVHDPAYGVRKLDKEQLSKHFTGVVLEAYPTAQLVKRTKVRSSLLDIIPKPSGMTKYALSLILLTLGGQFAALFIPFYVKTLVDAQHASSLSLVWIMLSAGFVVAFVQAALTYLRGRFVISAASIMSLSASQNIYAHLLKLPYSYFTTRHFSEIRGKFRSLGPIEQLFTTGVIELLLDGVFSLVLFGLLFWLSPLIACVLLSFIVILAALRRLYVPELRMLARVELEETAAEEATFIESVKTIAAIKAFGSEDKKFNLWQTRRSEVVAAGLRRSHKQLIFSTLVTMISTTEHLVTLAIAASLCFHGIWSVGTFMAAVQLKLMLNARMRGVFDALMSVLMSQMHIERLADIVMTEKSTRTQKLVLSAGALKVQNISKAYESKLVWSGVSLDVPAGKSLVITGPSGCGKTTLLHCLLGLLDIDAGTILYDGVALTNKSTLGGQVAAVLQTDSLSTGSLLDNIIGSSEKSDDKLLQDVLSATVLTDWIATLPMGIDTPVGQMGNQLSGGQVQRVLLARALYAQPKVLFLDEATSNLDVALEQQICQNIAAMNITRIMCAHRPQTIASADLVCDLTIPSACAIVVPDKEATFA